MHQIRLMRSDLVAAIDTEDVPQIEGHRWFAHRAAGGLVYARRNVNTPQGSRSIYMHRVIIDVPDGCVVDHVNHNGLDNRRINLRAVPHTLNLWNRRKPGTGVSQRNGKWRATLDHCGERLELGQYPDKETALAARQYVEAFLRGRPLPAFDPSVLAPSVRKLLNGH